MELYIVLWEKDEDYGEIWVEAEHEDDAMQILIMYSEYITGIEKADDSDFAFYERTGGFYETPRFP